MPLQINSSYRLWYLWLTIAGLIFVAFLQYIGFFEGINNYFYDLFFRIRGKIEPPRQVLIAAIDEKTLEKLGRWPIKRRCYAQLLEKLGSARVVGIDIIMAEKSKDDPLLARAIAKHGRVVLPAYIGEGLSIVYPVQSLSFSQVGHIHIEPGIDGIVREAFHTLSFNNKSIPSFSMVIVENYKTKPPEERDTFSTVNHRKAYGHLVQKNPLKVNYYGPPGTFPHLSAADILDGKYSPTFFKDKIVLIGLTAIGFESRLLTPFSQQRNSMSGVEVHANIVGNFLDNVGINDISNQTQWILFIILSFLSILLFINLTQKEAIILYISILFCCSIFVFFLLTNFKLWLSPGLIYGMATFLFIMAYIVRLDEAARQLDEEYIMLLSQLRWKNRKENKSEPKKGFFSFLSTHGIISKIHMVSTVTNALIFEKELTDKIIISDIHGIMLFDNEGSLLIANNKVKNTFEPCKVKMNNLKKFVQTVSPYVLENIDLEEKIQLMFQEDAAITLTISLENPEKLYLKVDASQIPFNDKKYVLFVFADITKIKEIELLKGQIVSTTTHELKQPLTAIRGYSELLLISLSEPLKEYASIINSESKRMTRLINTFLDITRLESGRQEIKLVPVNVVELVYEAVRTIKPVADEKSMTIHIHGPDVLPGFMLDRDLMKQCFINLIENAVKYSPPQTSIRIRFSEEQRQLRIDIIDNGYGIEKDAINRIWEKFYRAKSTSTSHIKGTGLGLAFVKEAIEKQGGTISVQSDLGKGSVFTIRFPSESWLCIGST